jgi:hypothetical protein
MARRPSRGIPPNLVLICIWNVYGQLIAVENDSTALVNHRPRIVSGSSSSCPVQWLSIGQTRNSTSKSD